VREGGGGGGRRQQQTAVAAHEMRFFLHWEDLVGRAGLEVSRRERM